MIMKMFSVRDDAVAAYLQPFFAPTTAAAIRSLAEAVNDPKHEFAKHAKDYGLYLLGEFDDADGIVTPSGPPPVFVLSCVDLINKL